ncbi:MULTISPECIES: DMT family transporter [Ramlibacter]|uniref:DMT family transporter n=1 Tax=Ramlibacter aquaticus TaxID=2780094 RepID=A0ABR9SIY9_9BURK|nr:MULTISPECIES: DMT family transporter [Ramlibacter]MBE7942315.1 DMT family transporter [Ramlibacter aquaticus]
MAEAGSAARGRWLAGLALLSNAFVWGVSWWPLRQLEAHGLHPLWSTALVYTVSMALMLAVRPRALPAFLRHPAVWILLVASGLTNVGFNWAVTVGDVVRVVLLFYLMPAWTVLLAWALLGQRPTAGALLRLALAMAGVFIVLKAPGAPWPVPEGAADWLSLAGGFSFALTNVLLRRLHAVPAEARVLAMFGGGAAMAALAALFGHASGIVPLPPALDAAWAGLALVLSLAFLGGNLGLQYGASRLDAHTSALVMLSEVVFASLSSVALGAAALNGRTLLGGALIVVAAAASALSGSTEKADGAESAP